MRLGSLCATDEPRIQRKGQPIDNPHRRAVGMSGVEQPCRHLRHDGRRHAQKGRFSGCEPCITNSARPRDVLRPVWRWRRQNLARRAVVNRDQQQLISNRQILEFHLQMHKHFQQCTRWMIGSIDDPAGRGMPASGGSPPAFARQIGVFRNSPEAHAHISRSCRHRSDAAHPRPTARCARWRAFRAGCARRTRFSACASSGAP